MAWGFLSCVGLVGSAGGGEILIERGPMVAELSMGAVPGARDRRTTGRRIARCLDYAPETGVGVGVGCTIGVSRGRTRGRFMECVNYAEPANRRQLSSCSPDRVLELIGVFAAVDDDGHRASDSGQLTGPRIRDDCHVHSVVALSHGSPVLKHEAPALAL